MRRPAAYVTLGLPALILLGWAAGALWTANAPAGELEFVREIAAQRTSAATTAARLLTWAGSAWVLVPLALCACVVFLRAGLRREAVLVALSLGGAIIISDVVKPLVDRPRPPVVHLQAVTGGSFPSGHTIQASAFWFSLVLALRSAGVCRLALGLSAVAAFLLVLAVALSRVYLGVHYPSDVIAGLFLGTGWVALVYRCVETPG